MREQKKQNLTDPNVRKRFVTYKEAAELYSMGLTRIQEHTKMAGATYKIRTSLKRILNNIEFQEIMKEWQRSLLQILWNCTNDYLEQMLNKC